MDDPQDTNQAQPDVDGSENTREGPRTPFGPSTRGPDDTGHFKNSTYLPQEFDSSPRGPRTRPRPKTDTIMIPNAGRLITSLIPREAGATEERRVGYRRWLESKTKEELITLILGLESEEAGIEAVQHLMQMYDEDTSRAASGSHVTLSDVAYTRLPIARDPSPDEPAPTWRVVLVGLDQNSRPIGLLIDGEITVGRAVGEATPDLDLTPFGARTKGVSRIHARLRPSLNGLMLVDSNSSNGTYWNRLRIPTQAEQPLKEGDVITFGRANFLVKMLRPPSVGETRTLF